MKFWEPSFRGFVLESKPVLLLFIFLVKQQSQFNPLPMYSLILKLILNYFSNDIRRLKTKILSVLKHADKMMRVIFRATDRPVKRDIKILVSATESRGVYQELLIDPKSQIPVLIRGKHHINIGWLYLGSSFLFFASVVLMLKVHGLFYLGIVGSFLMFLIASRLIEYRGRFIATKGMLYYLPFKEIKRIEVSVRT